MKMETPNGNDQVQIFFFPFVGGSHQIPMIDMARLFASHGARATIITTPKHSLSFQNSIARDQTNLHLPISIHTLQLPNNLEIHDTDTSAAPSTDTSMLQKDLLLKQKAHCIVHDIWHRWSAEAIDIIGTPRITFSGSGCFPKCVQDNMFKYKPQDQVASDYEPFVDPGLLHRIELTKSQLPNFTRPGGVGGGDGGGPTWHMMTGEEKSFGVVVNSFCELEGVYVDYLRTQMGNRAWLVGPVSLCNRHAEDKADRGKRSSLDEKSIVDWLDGKEPGSVLYVSFGSLVRLVPEQLLEIAYGLEASNCPFIWVVGEVLDKSGEGTGVENWLPGGLEERMKDKGLVIRGWAPQLLILEHGSVGGFMTHCGWNSTLEGVTAGVPMVTWPYSAEQFINEKLIVDMLKIGVKVGSLDWASWGTEPKGKVGRHKVEAAVRRLMCGDEDAEEMRRRAKELAEMAKRAVEVGGSSYKDVDALIEELKSLGKNEK